MAVNPYTKMCVAKRLRELALMQDPMTKDLGLGNTSCWVLLRQTFNNHFDTEFSNSTVDNAAMMLFIAQLIAHVKTDGEQPKREVMELPANFKDGEYRRICWNCDNCCPAPHGGSDAWCLWDGRFVDLEDERCGHFIWDREIGDQDE